MNGKSESQRSFAEVCHYVPRASDNEYSHARRRPRSGSTKRNRAMEPQTITFKELIDHATRHTESADSFSPKSLPNAVSALRGFVSEQGLSLDRPIGPALRAQFSERLGAHLATLRAGNQSSRSAANRGSLLRRWRRVLLRLDRTLNAGLGRQSPLQQALSELFATGRAVRPTAQAAGVPPATLRRWLAGHRPNARSLPGLARLERYLALPPGTLTDLSEVGTERSSLDTSGSPPAIGYRQRLRVQSANPYRLCEVNDTLRAQWCDLVHFKTAARTPYGMRRQRHGRWTVTRHPVTRRLPWYANSNGAYCATADLQWGLVSSFLGWLALPTERGGIGWPSERAQSLAHLADSSLIERYVGWRQSASGGSFHGGIGAFLRMVASMCHPDTGYLVQRSSVAGNSATEAGPADWLARCADARSCCIELLAAGQRDARASRNPNEALAMLLSRDNPMDALAEAVERMNAARPTCGGTAEALWARDRLMLKLLMSNPLRAKNAIMLTFSEHPPHVCSPPTGAVLYRAGGGWRIYVSSAALKNHYGAGARDYDAPVRPELTADIEEYLRFHRPEIAAPQNPYLFVSKKDGSGPMYSFNRQFARITRRFIPNCPGFGPHSLRHLVATSILKLQPNAWAVAAWVLHDREETVRAHYAHLRSDDVARWLSSLFDGAFKRM